MIILSTFLSGVFAKFGLSSRKPKDQKIYHSQEYTVFYQTETADVQLFIRILVHNNRLLEECEVFDYAFEKQSVITFANRDLFKEYSRIIPGEIVLAKQDYSYFFYKKGNSFNYTGGFINE